MVKAPLVVGGQRPKDVTREETLTEKVTGTLSNGARRNHTMAGYHVEFKGQDLNEVADGLAMEAGYKIGDWIEYEITIQRKAE